MFFCMNGSEGLYGMNDLQRGGGGVVVGAGRKRLCRGGRGAVYLKVTVGGIWMEPRVHCAKKA